MLHHCVCQNPVEDWQVCTKAALFLSILDEPKELINKCSKIIQKLKLMLYVYT